MTDTSASSRLRKTDAPRPTSDCATYTNPILYADYSDPDAIRVGEDYWMTASSFSSVPGLPILRSRDLVNWSIVNHALPRLTPEKHYAIHHAGCGVWAPSIRYHNGLFWIFYPDPDFGIYVITTPDPTQQWSEPHLLKAGRGFIDPCPLWDGDQAYLVHGWAKSRSGICNTLHLHEMSPDASQLLDSGQTVIDGNAETDWDTIEGPKIYKRDGWYWIFAPAGGVATGFQAVFRSRHVQGPYEARIALHQGETNVNGPHQGAWLETPTGDSWFIHFQEKLPFGRVVHLQPMKWNADGWPVMGQANGNDEAGVPVERHPSPLPLQDPRHSPAQSDDFSGGRVGRQWQWQANPKDDWAKLDPQTKGVTLRCAARVDPASLWQTGSLLMQKLTGPSLEATVAMDFAPKQAGDTAGMIVFGYDYFWIGATLDERGLQLAFARCLEAQEGNAEEIVETLTCPAARLHLQLRSTDDGHCRFAYRAGDADYQDFGPAFRARESKWVGAKFGIFATSNPGSQSQGNALFQSFIVS